MLKEKGYDPYAQLTGYITENEPTYITSHKGA
ncbi:IreB family regulatory phosphoprotein [Bacteroides nordii]